MFEIALMMIFAVRLSKPIFLRKDAVESATSPRAPTSIVIKSAFHLAEMFSIRFAYRVFFRISAASIPCSAGHVSSTMRTLRVEFDQIIISGLSDVGKMAGGKTIGQ